MMMECCKCGVELQMKKTIFVYLEHEMYHEVPCCPACGQVYIPEELANGKIAAVEMELEDK